MMERTVILNSLNLPPWRLKDRQLISRIVQETGWKRPGKQDKRDFFLRYLKHLKDRGVEIVWGQHAVRIVPNTERPFYKSREWKELRYQALKAHGARCQCCGATAKESGQMMHVDHIKPRSKFPHLALDLSNLQVLCAACNLGKSNIDETDWRQVA